jgi:hypothetical protein
MEPVKQAQKKYGSHAMVVAIVAGFIFILAGHKPVGKGLVLGTIFSVINFILIGHSLSSRLSQSKRKAVVLSLGSIIFRFAFLALPLILAVKYKQFNLPATIGGIFMIQLVILADYLVNAIKTRQKSP